MNIYVSNSKMDDTIEVVLKVKDLKKKQEWNLGVSKIKIADLQLLRSSHLALQKGDNDAQLWVSDYYHLHLMPILKKSDTRTLDRAKIPVLSKEPIGSLKISTLLQENQGLPLTEQMAGRKQLIKDASLDYLESEINNLSPD